MIILILIAVIAVIALCFFFICPGHGRPEQMQVFARQPIAHRGFHDNRGRAPENSMAAYRLAVEKGYGIELDVRESADGTLICMHDRNLKRATGIDKAADEMDWSQLKDLHLFGSKERIPRFRDVLEMVDGRVPIIMEIKAENYEMSKKTSKDAALLLDSYNGPVCMESFHPVSVRWFRKNRPEILRGQLSERFSGYGFPQGIGAFFLSLCFCNFLTKPDFIAYNLKHRNLLRFRLQRNCFHAVCAAWTVRSKKDMKEAASSFDMYIFEGFEPSLSEAAAGTAKKRHK